MEQDVLVPPRYLLPDENVEGSADSKVNTSYSNIPLIDREISWLQFNERVLAQAERTDLNMSKYHFLNIAENNLNEFISVRFADINEELKHNPSEELDKYKELILQMIQQQKTTIRTILSSRIEFDEVDAMDWLETFDTKIKSSICPILVGPNKDIPKFRDDELNLFIKLLDNRTNETKYCFIQIPSALGRRFESDGKTVMIEDIIQCYMIEIFPPNYDILGCVLFKVIKQCNEVLSNSKDSLVDRINKIITNRKDNHIIFLEVAYFKAFTGNNNKMLSKLQKLLKVQKENLYVVSSPHFVDINYVAKLDRVKTEYNPVPIQELVDEDSIFDYLDSEENLLVHHPYQSFDVVIRFLQEAANDPKVISIRQTLYRVSSTKSPIIKALCDAAKNGKHVTVMLELLARFDEQQNIKLINILKEAGCNVMYSLEELKTHCKICVVTRKHKGNLVNYAHVSTGNYNEKTSKIYTDISYFTNNPVTCEELITVFNYTIGFPVQSRLTKVSYSPATILPTMIERLRAIPNDLLQFENQNEEPRVVVSIKVNSINNFEFIKTVHDLATEFGFIEFRIICRGICALVPSRENIKIKSIVGKYLEHSRIFMIDYWCKNVCTMIGSADLLDRNLKRRIEVLVDVDGPSNEKVHKIFNTLWEDTDNSWTMDEHGNYQMVTQNTGLAHNAHTELSAL